MKEKFLNKRNILIIIFCLIIILVILYKIFSSPSKKNNIDIVKSSSKFYTVSSCISRYLNYLSSNFRKSSTESTAKVDFFTKSWS